MEKNKTEARNGELNTYFKEIKKYHLLTKEEEEELGKIKDRGPPEESQKAINKLTNHNLRLVISIAKRYRNRGLSFSELIQEGNIGLIIGAKKYDYTKGLKFSTYATWWIRQSITRSIADKSKIIRIPAHQLELSSKIYNTTKKIENNLGRKPSISELEEILKVDEATIKDNLTILKKLNTYSLDTSSNGNSYLRDYIKDKNSESAIQQTYHKELKESIEKMLDTLTMREREILKMLYGLNEYKEKLNLEKIGKRLKITRERARQIKINALKKLSNPERAKYLEHFLP